MNNFEVCPFADSRHYVIKINNPNIKAGKIEATNFLWIKYAPSATFMINGKIEKAAMLIFQDVDKETLDHIAQMMEIEFNKHFGQITLSELVNNLASLFKQIRQKNLRRDYLGLLGELFFIWKNQANNLDVKNYYQQNQRDQFDFNINDQKIDIKVLNTSKNSIKLNKKQLINFLQTNTQIFACEFHIDSHKTNLEQLFEQIDNSINLKTTQEKILFIKNNAPDLFDEIKIDLDHSVIKKFSKEHLVNNKLDLLTENFIINIKAELHFIEDKSKNVYEFIKEYINGKN